MSESQIEKIMEKLKELEIRVSKLEDFKPINVNKKQKKESIREFIISKNPRNDVQKTLAMGYYIEKYEQEDSFNINDIKKCFKDARERIPPNVADKIQLNIKKAHMMDTDKKDGLKGYILTNSGLLEVENNFEEQ
jgi:hypothetical protein